MNTAERARDEVAFDVSGADQLATFLRPIEPTDANSFNEAGVRFVGLATCYVKLSPLRAQELWRAQQVSSVATHKLEARWFPGLTSRWRVAVEGREFEILEAIDVRNQHVKWELIVVEHIPTP